MAEKLTHSYVTKKRTTPVHYWTIPRFLKHWADTLGDKEAFVFVTPDGGREVLSWPQVYQGSERFARALLQLGIQRGDIVGITVANSPEWLYATFGSMMSGAIPFSIAFTYADGSDVIGILEKVANCTTFILDPLSRPGIWDIFKGFLKSYDVSGSVEMKDIPSVKRLIVTSNPPGEQLLQMSEVMKSARDHTDLPTLDPDDIAILFQTSGSTGLPKAVIHTHNSLAASGASYVTVLEMTSSDKMYNDRQFGWIGGFPTSIACAGETRVCRGRSYGNQKVNPLLFMFDAVKQERCTCFALTLPMIDMLLAKNIKPGGEDGLWPLRLLVTGGQPMAKHYTAAVGPLCNILLNTYGSTEGLICVANQIKKADDFVEYSCGSPFEGVEVKIVDENGRLTPINTKGEIYVRSLGIFQGYYNDQEKTNDRKTVSGWLRTDDVGTITETGDIIVEGRKSDVIICGTINVYPSILETLFRSVKGIKEVMVVPIPHPTLFQVICVCATVETGSDVTEASLRKFCEDFHLDKDHQYTVLPAHYLIFSEFPQTPTGKTSRKDLTNLAVAKLGQSTNKQ